jgi:hypothetical protein
MASIETPAAAGTNTVARQEFGAQQLETRGETAATALAAQAKAMVEARFIVAMRRPRDLDDVRAKLLRACERPGFAGHAVEKVWGAAWYRKPVGEGVEGFSVRFAEEAIRALGNVDVEPAVTYDDDRKRILSVAVIDLETNVAYRNTIVVEKTVERRRLAKGQEALSVRVNSRGETTYLVEASDDEVFAKQNALISKTVRNAVLRLLPGDIQADCRTRILAIRTGDVARDPDKVRREVADAFAKLNVLPGQVKQYLGHELITATPAELVELRELYKDIQGGKTTWHEALAATLEARGEPEPQAPAPTKPGLDGFTEKLRAEQAAAAKGPCPHPDVPPSVVAGLAAGASIVCKACGEELRNPDAAPSNTSKGRQTRLQE